MKNLATDAEARKKWCPLVRVGNEAGCNRSSNDFGATAYCIASACMAWRKVDQIGIGPNGEKRDRDMDGRTTWTDRGYCGAFGDVGSQRGQT